MHRLDKIGLFLMGVGTVTMALLKVAEFCVRRNRRRRFPPLFDDDIWDDVCDDEPEAD